jgi:hypothetical protein
MWLITVPNALCFILKLSVIRYKSSTINISYKKTNKASFLIRKAIHLQPIYKRVNKQKTIFNKKQQKRSFFH